jgi:hypothetical protein
MGSTVSFIFIRMPLLTEFSILAFDISIRRITINSKDVVVVCLTGDKNEEADACEQTKYAPKHYPTKLNNNQSLIKQ